MSKHSKLCIPNPWLLMSLLEDTLASLAIKVTDLKKRIVKGYVTAGIYDVYSSFIESCRFSRIYAENGYEEGELSELEDDLLKYGILKYGHSHPGTSICSKCQCSEEECSEEENEHRGQMECKCAYGLGKVSFPLDKNNCVSYQWLRQGQQMSRPLGGVDC